MNRPYPAEPVVSSAVFFFGSLPAIPLAGFFLGGAIKRLTGRETGEGVAQV